jgi:AcrR family transcriptional regulator
MAEEPRTSGEDSPRWRRRKDARPQELTAAALELFVRQGFAATRVADIARQAGVTPGTVYVYFDNKEALLKAVVYESMVPVLAYANRRIEEYEGSARELFEELIHGWWEMIGDSRFAGIPRLIAAEASQFPDLARFYMEEVVERGRGIFARVLNLGIERGEFRPVDVQHAARLAMAPLQYASIHEYSLRPFDPTPYDIATYLDHHITHFLDGIAAAS